MISFLNTIRGRLALLALLTIIPALAVQGVGAWRDLRGDIAARQLDSRRALDHATGDFAGLLADTRAAFGDLVRVNEVRSPGNCTQVFTVLRFAYERLAPAAVNLGLADAEGRIYCAVNPVQGQRSLARMAAFEEALRTVDLAVGGYAANPAGGPPLVTVAYPTLSFDGQVQTVLFAAFAVGWLEDWLDEGALPPDSAITLLSAEGLPLWRAMDGKPVSLHGAETSGVAWLPDLRAGGPAVEGPDLDGVRRLHTVIPLRLGDQIAGYVHLGYPVAQLYTQAYQNLAWRLGLLGLVLLTALAIAWQGSERLFLRPLAGLMTAVQRLQAGDLSARVAAVRGLGEVIDLARAFDRMADALQQREAERRQLEERFRAAFESSAIGMGLLTLDGNILAANAAVCQMSGYTEEELRGRNDRENVYPPDADVGMDRFAEMLAGQRSYYSVERRYVRKNGEVFWVRLTLSLVRDDRGQPAYLVGQIEDIDEQKRKSAALAESEARFRTMFETSAIGIGIMGLDRKVISANPALCQMYGYTCEELVGQPSALVLHPDDLPRAMQSLQDLLEGKFDQFSDERRYIRKNGEVFWARIAMSMVRNAEGAPLYIVGMVADISEERLAQEQLAAQEAEYRRQLEQRIAERTAELNAANERLREKAALDAVAAERTRLARDLHDAVTQTLFSTTLIADVLPDLWAMNQAEGQRRLEELRQLTRGALAEMRTLLVELRPNALIEIPLPTLLRQLTEAMASRSRIAIQLSAEGECKLPADVQVGLYRIAQEALNNVVKHARASQAVVTLRLCDPVRLTVADDGAGFDPAAVTADHLGLRIMRERAEAIGAKLSIYSEPGEGTQVSVVWQQP